VNTEWKKTLENIRVGAELNGKYRRVKKNRSSQYQMKEASRDVLLCEEFRRQVRCEAIS
jgi:hypothetical protein